MEENTAAVECLILFYINTKNLLKTKQLDERVFLDQMIRHCRENGFVSYSNEEIRNTWKNLVLKYAELKKTGTVEERESWKYYEILDSCYEQSDFHNGVYPKFSEEMVWFLIECFLKRRELEKTQKRNSMLNEIHKDFLHSGYLYITRQDIENKWKYLNVKYDKLKDDPDAFSKLPYLQAVTRFREKDSKHLVRMIFTRELTEILIERFTVKKITCVIHGYDSEQVLSEIQAEFRDLGFDFSLEDIKEKWRKLTNVYSFLKVKGKDDSSWIYFNAMKEHFKDDFLFEFGQMGNEISLREEDSRFKPLCRPRSKSMGADTRLKLNNEQIKSNLVVNIEQLDDQLSPSPKRKQNGKIIPLNKRKLPKRAADDDTISPKKTKRRSKSKENAELKENASSQRTIEKQKNLSETNTNKVSEEATQTQDSISVRKNTQLTRLTVDQNGNQERRGSTDLGSPGSKVHIINIDESDIDKKSGNLTINLPSITKQFSDNEFLPLKKRLRLNGHHEDAHVGEASEIKDGFLGFPSTEVVETQNRLRSDSNECKRLTEEEMAEIMERINEDKSEKYGIKDDLPTEDQNYFKSGFNYNYLGPYNNFNQPCLIIPKEERKDSLPLQNFNNPNAITPPPVLLLVIKVDGSNSLSKDGAISEVSNEIEKRLKDSPDKSKPGQSNSDAKATAAAKSSSLCDGSTKSAKREVKPVSGESRKCTITHNDDIMIIPSVEVANEAASDPVGTTIKLTSPGGGNSATEENVSLVTIEGESTQTSEVQIKHNGLVKLSSPKGKSCTVTLNEKLVVPRNAGLRSNEANNLQAYTNEIASTDVEMPNKTSSSPKKWEEHPQPPESIPGGTTETNATVSPVHQKTETSKSVRLPVKGGGKLKEIFISPKELKKISQLNPENFKPKAPPAKPTSDGNLAKNSLELSAPPKPPLKIKFMSHVIRPPTVQSVIENKPEKAAPKNKVDNTIDLTGDDNQMLPPSTSFAVPNKFVGTNNSSSRTVRNEEFENESVFSEAVGDDEGLKDNLLATVIDFQEQNNQEFVEIKNLMKQNNLLQRETNRLLRLMLEKM